MVDAKQLILPIGQGEPTIDYASGSHYFMIGVITPRSTAPIFLATSY